MDIKNISGDVKVLISSITHEQSKPFQTSIMELLASAKENKLEEAILKQLVPIYELLEILNKENKINKQQYNQRRIALQKLSQLAEEVNINHKNTL